MLVTFDDPASVFSSHDRYHRTRRSLRRTPSVIDRRFRSTFSEKSQGGTLLCQKFSSLIPLKFHVWNP